MRPLTLGPVRSLSGDVRLPGSKSISNRALLLAAMAEGRTRLVNPLRGDDTRVMLDALALLGINIAQDGEDLTVDGVNGPLVTDGRRAQLHLGLAGTAFRPLTAALTLGNGEFELDGVPRMRERPIAPLVEALTGLGADIEYTGVAGHAPLRVRGRGLNGGDVAIDGTLSSQFLTSLLLAAPLAGEEVNVTVAGELVSKPYIDITLDLMRRFGVEVEAEPGYRAFRIPVADYRSPGRLLVEGDASAATYFLAAGAIRGEGVRVHGIGADSIQGDLAFTDVLQAMGARVTRHAETIEAAPGRLRGIQADLNHIPDAAMTVAVLALFAEGRTRIDNIYNWRVKETDRLDAMTRELGKLGAVVEEGRDYLVIDPPAELRPATISTYGDHRMAMCFSLAALGGVSVTLDNPDCVAKTFPDYFEVFSSLADRP
ncbi:MAG: 3-phosphoshikimate 1-carboxyvinyltransferase [Gammaproteobacteria bacterium]|nr:3-phosphoshikimate 1-carboxyvinyltransferase [Gammaproteobacteria bacterium]MDE0368410.1 3-phosphoshikimate 1-carboxyvinyltransferase [Gammaproteobacteria bacterium]